ncbi:MAG: DUF885 domain-containing protein, partial [Gemmatimonadaceae bacterium]|nr:DUF885 domain-containing protein [Gloeobacterales cyanobacterium ES-bin-141]
MSQVRVSLRTTVVLVVALAGCLVSMPLLPASAQPSPPQAASKPAWVERSNQNAQVLLDVLARFNPEDAGRTGVEGLDEQVIDLKLGVSERYRQALTTVGRELEAKLAREKDPLVRQDLEILVKAAGDTARGSALDEKYDIPYINATRLAFGGLRALLDEQVSPQRRRAALVRLKRYAGLEEGYTPLTILAEQRTRERLNTPGLIGPIKAEVEKDLATANALIDGIDELFKRYEIAGYQELYTRLKEQLSAYNTFVRQEVLPRARADFRQPPEKYAFALQQDGVDIPPAELATRARTAFNDIQKQMQQLAPEVAKQKGLTLTDYREVISALKGDQLVGEEILPHYRKRISEIEAIIKRENLVTLPERPAWMRLASAAESAVSPAPHMQAPRLLGNTGEMGEFVLPLNIPTGPGTAKTQKPDDFTFAAASWSLTAHEARPGHEMQFASIIEKGVSTARAVFAANSTNIEGWGLYSEAIMLPYMPPEGQLISLQFRLRRAARAFLDPELQLGKITPQEALRLLKEEVVVSDAYANQEVERYTFRSPGQATSYFYGFTRLMELRSEVERARGVKFDRREFHDFILAQGLLPPAQMRKAVLEQFGLGSGA